MEPAKGSYLKGDTSVWVFFKFFIFKFIIFLNFWLCWVLVAMHRLSLAMAGATPCCSVQGPQCRGFSCCGARAPVVVARGLSRSSARRILPGQGPNPRSLHWQADSQPLRHQGSPKHLFVQP